MINTVVFDLDDTLFPEHQFVLSGFRAVDKWISCKYSVTGFYVTAKRLFEQKLRGNIFDVALARLNIDCSSALINELVQVYREHKPSLSLFEDANWAIGFYKGSRQLAMITDGYLVTQRNKVLSLGLDKLFNTIIYSDEYGRDCWKPSKVPYLKIMEQLGCSGSECIYIGDNPLKDFITAKALGWSTVQICRCGAEYSEIICENSHKADYKITSLLELKELII